MTLSLIDGVELTRTHATQIPRELRSQWFYSLRDYIVVRFVNDGTMPPSHLPDVLWYIDALQKELC